ncbi:CbtA family protein [Ancylobacter mangrovi]|uniref:CbtA family protein n=1 Tax=Ancylobacter mangrovi TaxID=2972472 RepID=UPI0021637DBC|nr:CbtA family protein [Ancylobacter mangrovi]MCS0504737.1 CbtA family protein [Ancylobacter mangrovi]
MVRSLLLRGMLVGLFAGLLAFGFARTFGEPQVDRAIAFEEQMSHAAGEVPEPELVSRTTQAGLGLFTGIVVYSAAIGGLFALVFAFVQGRVGSLGPRATAALLALAAFIAVVAVPFLKYPANPPSVGSPETIRARTELYFIMLAFSLAFMLAAVLLARGLWERYGGWQATILACLVFVVLTVIANYALPDINEVPEQFSATLLWQFRLASLGIQAILWTTLGLLFGYVAERAGAGSSRTRPAAALGR